MEIDLSVVIPCYNHGIYLNDAVESIVTSKYNYEVIIIDDGSTDLFTLTKIKELVETNPKIKSHTQINSGLAKARNKGIELAKGKFIIPLDADNKITSACIEEGIAILENEAFDIVYGNPIFFGEQNIYRQFKPKAFNGNILFFDNYIDACAIFKKEVWLSLNGFDEKMPYQGNEDWEFWLHAYIKGFKFKYLNKGLYYYRIRADSMIVSVIKEGHNQQNFEYMIKKHHKHYAKILPATNIYCQMYLRDLQNPVRSIFKYANMALKKLFKM